MNSATVYGAVILKSGKEVVFDGSPLSQLLGLDSSDPVVKFAGDQCEDESCIFISETGTGGIILETVEKVNYYIKNGCSYFDLCYTVHT